MPRITEQLVRGLDTPLKGLRFVWDDKITGFGVRVTANGTKAFVFRYVAGGRGGKERLWTIGQHGEAPKWSVAAARAKADDIAAELRNTGRGPFERQDLDRQAAEAEAARPDVARLCADYLERHAPRKRDRSAATDRSMISRYLLAGDRYDLSVDELPPLGTKRVDAVTVRDVEDLHNALKATPYQANRVLALLSKMFNLAVKWGWRADNPAKGIERFPEERRERWLDCEELRRLAGALDEMASRFPRAVNCIRLLLLTGSRKHEAFAAEWGHIDFQRGVWVKPSSHTKQKKAEHVPLSAPTLALLAEMKAGSVPGEKYLFPGDVPGNHITDIKKAWALICDKAELDDVRLHDLRHSFASHLVSSGMSLEIVGKLMGHTQVATTKRYAHLADTPLREATERMGRIVTNAREKVGAAVLPLRLQSSK
jgi:integrase